MRNRLCALALVLGLLLSPALAAEESPGGSYEGFADVRDTDWFAPYVEICAERGLMNGTGGGSFSPDRSLSVQECVLALRLYDLNHGGDGIFDKAPEDWGRITLVRETDSLTLSAYYGEGGGWYIYGGGHSPTSYYFIFPVEPALVEEWEAYAPVTVTIDGQSFTTAASPMGEDVVRILSLEEFEQSPCLDAAQQNTAPAPGLWHRDAWYYAHLHEAEDYSTMAKLIEGYGTATRWDFAYKLAQVVGDLPAINQIEHIPVNDWQEDTLLPLYNGGILTGLDEHGTFYPEGTLTRAEAAAMLARVLEPELRISFTPEPPNYQDYTLIELDTAGYNPEPETSSSSDYLFLSLQDMNDYHMDYAILLPDGSIVYPPEGYRFKRYVKYGLIGLIDEIYSPISTVMDLYTGEIILPPAQYGTNYYLDGEHLITLTHTGTSSPPLTLWNRTGQQIAILPQNIKVDWSEFREGVVACQDEGTGLYGYVDAAGNWTLPPQWIYAEPFSDGAAIVRNVEEKWGVIDHDGAFLIPCQYDFLRYYGDGLYLSSNQNVSLWIPLDGEPFYDTHLIRPHNGYIADGQSYLDADYRPATPSLFDWTGPVGEDGSAFAGMDGKVYRITFHTPQSEP